MHKYPEESKALSELWEAKSKLSQGQFGIQFGLGNQSYVHQCLTGKADLNLKSAMAFARHLNCHVSEFSPRLDDEIAKIVDFAYEQQAVLLNKQMFTREVKDGL